MVENIGSAQLDGRKQLRKMEAHLCIHSAESGDITRDQRTFPEEAVLPSPYDVESDVLYHLPVAKGDITTPFGCIEARYEDIIGLIGLHFVVVQRAAYRILLIEVIGDGQGRSKIVIRVPGIGIYAVPVLRIPVLVQHGKDSRVAADGLSMRD